MITRRCGLLLVLLLVPVFGLAMTTAFTYQGYLRQDGAAVSGVVDLQCTLYDAVEQGMPVSDPLTLRGVNVEQGVFTVQLDFGIESFIGGDCWLEIAVASGDENFTTLSPRHPLTPTPYALYAHTVPWANIIDRPETFGLYQAGQGLTLTGNVFSIEVGAITNEMIAGVSWNKLSDIPASFAPGGPAGGDLTGAYPNPMVGPGTITHDKMATDADSLAKVSGGIMVVRDAQIGIGTATPAAGVRLDINGAAKMSGFQLGSSAVAGQVLTADGAGHGFWVALPTSLPPNGTAGGDLTGTYPNPIINTGKITTTKLADSAVTPVKIADAAVTNAKLANAGVTTEKLADAAVTTVTLADLAVTSVKLMDAAVSTAKLTDKAVTTGKLADGAAGAGQLAWDPASLARVSNGIMTATTTGINIGTGAPVGRIMQVYATPSTALGVQQVGHRTYYQGPTPPWQSFTAPASTTLAALEVMINGAGASTQATLTLFAGEGTTGSALSIQTVTLDANIGYKLFTLPTPITLTSGQLYTFAFSGFSGYLRVPLDNAYGAGRA